MYPPMRFLVPWSAERAGLHRNHSLCTDFAVCGLQGRQRSPGARLPSYLQLPVTISNCSNNYGPNQFPEKLIPLMICNAQAGNPCLSTEMGSKSATGSSSGITARPSAILVNGRLGETYNIGGGNQPTNLAIVQTICDFSTRCSPHAAFPASEADPFRHRPARPRPALCHGYHKIRSELGWNPRHSLASRGCARRSSGICSKPIGSAAICSKTDLSVGWNKNYEEREKQP